MEVQVVWVVLELWAWVVVAAPACWCWAWKLLGLVSAGSLVLLVAVNFTLDIKGYCQCNLPLETNILYILTGFVVSSPKITKLFSFQYTWNW